MDLTHLNLNQVQDYYRNGMLSESEMVTYIKAWNAGPHFTQAVFCDGAIRNFDPEKGTYRYLWDKFGVRA